MTSGKSFFGALLGAAFMVGPVLAPLAQAQAQETQPAPAALGKESESERLARRLNAEIDRRDAPVRSKRAPAEQAKYDRELAKENELLQKSGRDAGERYKEELRAAQARSAEEKRARARALGISPPPHRGM
jgi:hypothetical protein